MKRLITISLSLFISSCTSLNIDPYLALLSPNHLSKDIDNVDVSLVWSKDIGEERDYKTGVLQPIFKDGISYTIDSQGYVSAINLSSGKPVWVYDLDMNVSSGLGMHDNKIFFGTNDGMYYGFNIDKLATPYSFLDNLDFINLLDDTKVEPDVSIQLQSEASSPAVGIDNLIFIKLDDGDTASINLDQSLLEWNYKGRNVPLSMKGSAAIATLNNNIFVPRDDGNIISLVANTGKLNWLVSISARSGRNELESLRDVEITPIIDNGVLYIGSFQGNLVSIDIFTGSIIWSKPMSVISHLSVDSSYLYVSDNSGSIYALDKYDGSVIWKQSMPEQIITTQTHVIAEYLVTLSTQGHIIILNKEDGRLLTKKDILSDIDPQSRGLMIDKLLYIVTKDGRLNAIKIN